MTTETTTTYSFHNTRDYAWMNREQLTAEKQRLEQWHESDNPPDSVEFSTHNRIIWGFVRILDNQDAIVREQKHIAELEAKLPIEQTSVLLTPAAEPGAVAAEPSTFKVGDEVYVEPLGKYGTVTAIHFTMIEVNIGGNTRNFKRSILRALPAAPDTAAQRAEPFAVGDRVWHEQRQMTATIIEVNTANWVRVQTAWLYDGEFDWRTKEIQHYYDQPQPANPLDPDTDFDFDRGVDRGRHYAQPAPAPSASDALTTTPIERLLDAIGGRMNAMPTVAEMALAVQPAQRGPAAMRLSETVKLSKRQLELLQDMAVKDARCDSGEGRTSCHCNHHLYDGRTLGALRSKGLAETVRPFNWTYRITPAGRDALKR